ncbi:hypothetical protein E0H86_15605 [Acinetobacter sp. ANC 4635]|uniref:hypothetical protein n=1 Tax=Acinetobacter sp. ANC 4635 TaxID=2529846 RepID=UPI0010391183|nr:hypothetical protein [Acinetobacter sp. ANC 4635]TCB23838.1 hypothetical protein E0H86_15605 [Acinetobacter sp. ANC 4635]
MAFDLFHYFAEQTRIQKPRLLSQFSPEERQALLLELNALALGKLITEWQQNASRVYLELQQQDQLYIQQVARHMTTSVHNKSTLNKLDFEQSLKEVLSLQLAELKQLDDTGHLGQKGLNELLLGQIGYLAGQAQDWVWTTNTLIQLIGSKPVETKQVSLDETIKEFNHMVSHADHHDDHQVAEPTVAAIPTWAKILEPAVGLVIIGYLYCAYQQIVG